MSTGGTSQPTTHSGRTYASAAAVDIRSWSTDEKLDFLIEQVCVTQSLTTQIHQVTGRLDNAYKAIDQMQNYIHSMHDRISNVELRALDNEARSRRNNLVFYNISEPDSETVAECEATLRNFLIKNVKINETVVADIVFQRVHRLGRKRYGTAPDGRAWRPRPVIAGFRDYGARELVMDNAKELKGTSYSIQQDYPPEIKAARGELWDDLRRAKAENKRATIAYPAKLIVDGRVIRDMFPGWNKWAIGTTNRDTRGHDDRAFPRSGTPINIPMADLISAPEFRPRAPLPPPTSMMTIPESSVATAEARQDAASDTPSNFNAMPIPPTLQAAAGGHSAPHSDTAAPAEHRYGSVPPIVPAAQTIHIDRVPATLNPARLYPVYSHVGPLPAREQHGLASHEDRPPDPNPPAPPPRRRRAASASQNDPPDESLNDSLPTALSSAMHTMFDQGTHL